MTEVEPRIERRSDNAFVSQATFAFRTAGNGALIMIVATACGSSAQPQPVASQPQAVTYACVDENGRVLDMDECDDDHYHGGGHYIWYSSGYHDYPKGSVVSGGSRVAHNNPEGRRLMGVSERGAPVVGGSRAGSSGTVVGGSSKSGGSVAGSGGSVSYGGIGSSGGHGSSSGSSGS